MKNPRAFRLGSCPVPYFSNKTAGTNCSTFLDWFLFVFLPRIRRGITEKVVLIVDNAYSHCRKLQHPTNQVVIILLPPKVTSVYQPTDIGIILAWKRRYTKLISVKSSEKLKQELNVVARMLQCHIKYVICAKDTTVACLTLLK